MSWNGLTRIRFIELYLDCTATRDNVAMLLGIAAKIKTVKDADKELTDNSVGVPHRILSRLPGAEPVRLERVGTGDDQEPGGCTSLASHLIPWQDPITERHLSQPE